MGMGTSRYSIYGLVIETDFEFENRLIPADSEPPDIRFRCVDEAPVGFDVGGVPVFEAGDRGDGEPSFVIFRADGSELIHVHGSADFYLYDDRIDCQLLDPGKSHMIEILLLGTVLAYWLERNGVLALHASAAVKDGYAIGVAGLNGAGKTSLSASLLMRGGYRLLTDDILAVSFGDQTPLAHSGYPQMRMWPDLAAYFFDRVDDLEIVHPDFEKKRIAVGTGGFGSFCHGSVPLVGVLLPRRDDSVLEPEVEMLSDRDALVHLAAVSFIAGIAESALMQWERLPRLRRLAETVPVLSLSYPPGLSSLPEVAKVIDTQFENLVQSNSARRGIVSGSKT